MGTGSRGNYKDSREGRSRTVAGVLDGEGLPQGVVSSSLENDRVSVRFSEGGRAVRRVYA